MKRNSNQNLSKKAALMLILSIFFLTIQALIVGSSAWTLWESNDLEPATLQMTEGVTPLYKIYSYTPTCAGLINSITVKVNVSYVHNKKSPDNAVQVWTSTDGISASNQIGTEQTVALGIFTFTSTNSAVLNDIACSSTSYISVNATNMASAGANHDEVYVNFVNITINYSEDPTPPTVNINFGLDETFTNDKTPSVDFNFTDNQSGTANCTLYFNDSPYNTTNNINNNTQTNLTVDTNLSDANYTVYVNCTDNASNLAKSLDINIIIDSTPPTVNINISLNNTITSDQTPSFDFNFTDSWSSTANCTLYFNDTAYNTTNNIGNNSPAVLISDTNLSDSNYSVYVNCSDQLGNTGKSEILNIRIDITAPIISNVINWSITGGIAWINWTTDEPANGSVIYGTTTDMTNGTKSHSDLRTLRNITLTGLEKNTLYYYNVTSCDALGNRNTSGSYTFNTTSNNAPNVDTVDSIPAQTPNADTVKIVNVNFTVTDIDGISDLNHSSAKVVFSKNDVNRNGTCSNISIDIDTTQYNCTVSMQYYDQPGNWSINVSVLDNFQASAYNATTNFTYNTLLYVEVSPTVFGFGDFYPSAGYNASVSNPLLLDNMGNVNLTQINITGINLVSGSYVLGVSNVTVNVSDAPGISLQNNTAITIPDARVNLDVNGVDANESLYFYITIPNIPALDYVSSSDWVISVGD
ncbi:hypothetical protein AYK26_06345 [Euryarchaeota archaeon SM23-78]|nr:MAG: hypothetical protein AYK26_06345 [Euryarchaeota archaeon SM23-78]MBW3001055.1 fibronectin type III domain-containing protein [Candidatus Woesearchaeota archaeon]